MKLMSWTNGKTKRAYSDQYAGLGLFANDLIDTDELIAIKAGHIVDEDYINNHSDIVRGSHMQITDSLFLAPTTEQEWHDTLIGINHSCKPNAYVSGDVCFRAYRKIKAGEEITIDYGTAFSTDSQAFDCICGEEQCRRFIRPQTDWQASEIQERHEGHFAAFLERRIMKEQNEAL